MRILVISDSHGNYAQALKAHERAGEVDHIIHLGDGCEDALFMEQVLEVPVIRVAGNCDLDGRLPNERCLELGTSRFFVTHGNNYQVKSGLSRLKARGAEVAASVVLYGHTHLPAVEALGGVLYVNPGQLKFEGAATCAIVTLDDGAVRAEILRLG